MTDFSFLVDGEEPSPDLCARIDAIDRVVEDQDHDLVVIASAFRILEADLIDNFGPAIGKAMVMRALVALHNHGLSEDSILAVFELTDKIHEAARTAG